MFFRRIQLKLGAYAHRTNEYSGPSAAVADRVVWLTV